jgi:signal transduction histidine kinase
MKDWVSTIIKSLRNWEIEIAQINYQNKEQEKITKFTKLISICLHTLSLLFVLYRNNIIRNKSNLLLQEKTRTRNCQKQSRKGLESEVWILSTVSHELRTPLNANRNYSFIIRRKSKKTQLDYLSSLKFSGII